MCVCRHCRIGGFDRLWKGFLSHPLGFVRRRKGLYFTTFNVRQKGGRYEVKTSTVLDPPKKVIHPKAVLRQTVPPQKDGQRFISFRLGPHLTKIFIYLHFANDHRLRSVAWNSLINMQRSRAIGLGSTLQARTYAWFDRVRGQLSRGYFEECTQASAVAAD